jgi:hypothetical protein
VEGGLKILEVKDSPDPERPAGKLHDLIAKLSARGGLAV